MHWRQPITAGQVGAHLVEELVVIEQPVKLDQYGVHLVGQFRYAGEDVFGRIAVNKHPSDPFPTARTPLSWCSASALDAHLAQILPSCSLFRTAS